MKKYRSILLFLILPLVALIGAYLGVQFLFQFFVDSGAKKLVRFEKQGALSRDYGYVWQEINANKGMNRITDLVSEETHADSSDAQETKKNLDFPSLAAVEELNGLKSLHKIIRINDRNGVALAQIRTTHTSVDLRQLNDTLIQSLLITEDKDFYTRKKAYDYNALLRATVEAIVGSVRNFKLQYPRGSSTIHMQVARFLLLRYNSEGYAYVEKTISRKIKELKLAQALKMMYTNEEILTLYVNHCVSAGRGMQGYFDISMGLFGTAPDSLSVAQSLYLARLVKWNRHVPSKVIHQAKISLPALAQNFDWTREELNSIRASLDTLSFRRPKPLIPKRGYILDLANEYWRKVCIQNGMTDSLFSTMDIANPESEVRRYGNLTINLTIDYRLQRRLEQLVKSRGFGPDTTIRTDIRIGSYGTDLTIKKLPPDTIRRTTVFDGGSTFGDLPQSALRALEPGDTVVCNIRYRRKDADTIRRSSFYYKRDTLRVPGQYHAYAMMDSRTHKLLAYYSTDQLGSRLRSLHVNKNPNGSSVTKPLIYALAYDLGIYQPSDMAADDREFGDTCAWARSFLYNNDTPTGMIYHNVPEDSGYSVSNHGHSFDGYDFLYNHLSHSNNILAVETMYQLTTNLNQKANVSTEVKSFLKRLGWEKLVKSSAVTGPQVYSALVSTLRAMNHIPKKHLLNYSIALGTLELSLYEQMHLFNLLYDNSLTVTPENHPSLFIENIFLGGKQVRFTDDIVTKKVFSNRDNLAPVHLALHKRLTSNPGDGLSKYDFCGDSSRVSNFAKSGTTDDIIRPFNVDITDTARTNYGLWNAVLKLRLKKTDLLKAIKQDTLHNRYDDFPPSLDSIPDKEELDVTIACFGECNEQYTGQRDGKSLHGYISRDLLHAYGVPCTEGFYGSYEAELVAQTSDKEKYATEGEQSDLSFFSRAMIKLKTGMGSEAAPGEVRFEKARFGSSIRLKGENYRMMLKFAQYMGDQSHLYRDLVNDLKKVDDRQAAERVITRIDSMQVSNRILERDLKKACASLRESLEMIGDGED